ncbi:MAG: N-succinylarginine dihydrolase [Oceanicaulis sp.]|nr:N-succinylarginine dihydrolase [Oceanicaulis sp.]
MSGAVEANFDGLVGPTHNYGGLAPGNLASAKNRGAVAHPRPGVVEGLAKARRLADAGLAQGLLPPQERPDIPALRALGFNGRTDGAVWEAAYRSAPELALNMLSASSMWAANAATVSPGADTSDARVHFTPANLVTALHRSIEHPQTQKGLSRIFANETRFAVHGALPSQAHFADEGAANHVRLCAQHGAPGVEIFVHGRDAFEDWQAKYPARQTLQACEAVARRHGLDPARTVHIRQSRKAIEAGAFHNDVVCVGTGPVLFYHEHAFEDSAAALDAIRRAADGLFEPVFVEVPDAEVPLSDAITSYLFNSQLLIWPGESRQVLLAPKETEEPASTLEYCQRLTAGNGPIGDVRFADVRQSMRNGGGPACLRLRVVLDEAQRAAVNPRAWLTPERHDALTAWANANYRETLAPEDLGDPALVDESRAALDALTQIMGLGTDFYPFQRMG